MSVAPPVPLRSHSPSKGLRRSKKTCFVQKTVSVVKPSFYQTRPNTTSYAMSKSKSLIRKPFIRHTSPKPSISPPRVNAANPSAVSAARVNAAKLSAVSAARINAAKSSAVTAV
uniref:Uncharacterized protein n=1 Tax=Tanacetum cinerariifolium TaxID=118510 RepID=A0A699TEN6_TANCI|nr:hypothetical protein [Tanacetum cinerariifolium]